MEVKRTGDWEWIGYRNGKEIGKAGITTCWEGRGYGWLYEYGLTKREWIEVTKHVLDALDEARRHFNRIEIAVYHNHPAGHRWARRLGFQLEHQPKRYMPNGENGYLYVMFGEP